MRSFRHPFRVLAVSFVSALLLAGCGSNSEGPSGGSTDTTAPVVSLTVPSDGATDVAINRPITVTFNEAMDPSSLTPSTFILTQAGAPITGAVSYAGMTATLTPGTNLAPNTAFVVTVTDVARDITGNRLPNHDVWGFTTGNHASAGPLPVHPGAAGEYVILAKSAVSTTGATAVVGNIGLSPAAGSYLTGFSQVMDYGNTFSTAGVVTGRLYAADYAAPTPASLTQAVLDMQAAYTDAAGRTLPDHTELGAGNIDGMSLVPGLYKWGTGVNIPTHLTLTGGANDVWIFQIAQDLTVGNAAIITLDGGALPGNIFWQVAGQTNLGTTSSFQGVILCHTLIAMHTGATVHGRAYAQTAVTLDATALTAP